ncbi:putative phosphopantetheinyl transferase [Flavobacterium psychrophilum]|uniref:4'-phosphopantetheinyl transferase family protein n=1 Tax=Flavobacterium psychrophilum TaxID=96345 RepID=UPI00090380C6|nr:4'-phosphopantetheinyl transferase superfamily protein [Flavobacterium psychrophilum]EKT3958008.1 4'-phosphopantetheinyl transferase superfamily protein [Flavobacterium psychrophilum]OJH13631.1 4-phosphopantetheinyl transferase [Flavobacterium psychrophilum]QZK99128.1 4'-phosphopantetheinyl transferase superfamily protein [Flavobacterium psychrophilum]SNA65799.1 putative phosphopantetheinyl transferase [Flavobacterium psychrophilum]SNB14241.1 putative phosphopantetheinyl transferase [Flavob
MPLHKIITPNSSTKIYIWKIEETFEDLFDQVVLNDINLIRLNTMKSEMHQRGFLSVRKLLQEAGYADTDLHYNQDGKPHLKDNKFISISHSSQFSTIAISDKPIGIDIELAKEKVLKIASRFMNVSHLEGLSVSEKIRKATVVWGIKESIFKIKNEKGISFPDHIFENPFLLSDKKATAQLSFNNTIASFDIFFEEINADNSLNYTLVYAFEN